MIANTQAHLEGTQLQRASCREQVQKVRSLKVDFDVFHLEGFRALELQEEGIVRTNLQRFGLVAASGRAFVAAASRFGLADLLWGWLGQLQGQQGAAAAARSINTMADIAVCPVSTAPNSRASPPLSQHCMLVPRRLSL